MTSVTVAVLRHVSKVTSSSLASELGVSLHPQSSCLASFSSQLGCRNFGDQSSNKSDKNLIEEKIKSFQFPEFQEYPSKVSSQTLFEEKINDEETNRLEKDEPFKNFVENSEDLKHFTRSTSPETVTASEDYTMPHPIWSKQESEGVEVTHRKPKGFVDYAAYGTVSVMRFGFDVMSGYKGQKKLDTSDEKAVLTRYIILVEW